MIRDPGRHRQSERHYCGSLDRVNEAKCQGLPEVIRARECAGWRDADIGGGRDREK